jgi:hypothetical protein
MIHLARRELLRGSFALACLVLLSGCGSASATQQPTPSAIQSGELPAPGTTSCSPLPDGRLLENPVASSGYQQQGAGRAPIDSKSTFPIDPSKPFWVFVTYKNLKTDDTLVARTYRFEDGAWRDRATSPTTTARGSSSDLYSGTFSTSFIFTSEAAFKISFLVNGMPGCDLYIRSVPAE